MALNKYKLGDLIEVYKEKCGISDLEPMQVSGINKDKEFFEPSNQIGSDTSSYQMVFPGSFACNLMHVGRDCVLPIAYNHTDKIKHVSPAYIVFKLINNVIVLDDYFMMLFKSNERDRKLWFSTDSSVRDGMSLDDFKNVCIEIPDLATQEKYVNIYKSMIKNQEQYERGLDDLKLTCDAYIEDLRRKNQCFNIGKYICQTNKNVDGKITKVLGIGQTGFIMPQKEPNESLKNYKIISKGDIAYAPPLYNILTGALHCYQEKESAVCSPIYEVFKCDKNILPEYLTMWLKRDEFIRYAEFYSLGVRQTFDFSLMCDVKIPIPSIEIQQSIVNIYKVYNERKQICDKLKEQIKNICPILIKGAIEEAREV